MNAHKDWQYYLINNEVEFWPTMNKLISCKTGREYSLFNPASCCLLALIANQPNIVTQAELIKQGWGIRRHAYVSANAFYQCILMLRRVLKKAGLEQDIIRTIPRHGLKIPEHISISFRESESSDAARNDVDHRPEVVDEDPAPKEQVLSLPLVQYVEPAPQNKEVETTEIYISDAENVQAVLLPPSSRRLLSKFLRSKVFRILCFSIMLFLSAFILNASYNNYKQHNIFLTYNKVSVDKDNCQFFYNDNAIIYDKHNDFIKKMHFDCSKLNKVFISGYLYSSQINIIQCRFGNGIYPKKYCISKNYINYEK